jgi:hypothetical protein
MIKPQQVEASTGDVHAPASNTAAVVTYAATSAGRHALTAIAWSYSAAPTGGNLKIEDGSGTVIFSMDITAAGANSIDFPLPKCGRLNTAMIVTLAAGGSGITGKVNVINHYVF